MYRYFCVSARAAVFAVLICVLGAETPNIVFSDVPANHWAKDPVYRAVNQLRVAQGYPDGTLRGDEKISRYETLTYLNNLSLTMESMMDKKLQNAGGASADQSALRQELDDLKARLAAIESGRVSSDSLNIASLLQDKAMLDIFSRTDKSNPVDPDNRNESLPDVYARVNFKLGRYGLYGYEFSVNENIGGFSAWATKQFSPSIWLRLNGSVGQGQVVDRYDRHVLETPDTALGITLGLWDAELGLKHGIVDADGVDIAYDYNEDNTADQRFVDKTTARAQYTIPLKIPVLNTATLEYGVDNYYTEPNGEYHQDIRTLRYMTRLRFDINSAENRFFQTRAIKETREANRELSFGQLRPDREQSQYYEILLGFGDPFKRGSDITIMAAQKDLYFGANGLGENLAGVNLLGYSAGDYLTSRMPTADETLEYGIKITQKMLNSELLATFVFVRGEANPDRTISPDYDDDVYNDCYYIYEQHVLRLDWYLRPNSSLYLEHEQTDLTDSSKGRKDQYFLVANKVGARFAF